MGLVVAQQGIEGSYHDIVRQDMFPDSTMMGLDSFHEVVLAVEERTADVGIMAIENSIHADTPAALELRTNFEGLEIFGEMVLDITHRLIGVADGEIDEIRSHQVAISQCRKRARELYPGVRLVESVDTAVAVEEVSRLALQGMTNVAAIGSRLAGQLHPHLTEIQSDMNDYDNNQTRFLIFKREDNHSVDSDPDNTDKTTVRLVVPDRKDGLLDAMKVLSYYDVNYTSLIANGFRYDSRDGNIVVPAEFTHAWHDDRLVQAVAEIEGKLGGRVRNLGSYPTGKVLKV